MRRIEEILPGWPDWDVPFSEPRLLRELPGGRTNRTYLLEADDQRWVLRISAPDFARLGIDRHREAAILENVVAAGIAPEMAYCSVEKGILISEYIDGHKWPPEALAGTENLERLLTLIERVHALKPDVPAIDYYAHAEFYWHRLTDAGIDIPDDVSRQRAQITARRDVHPDRKQDDRLCHHDLTRENLIDRDGRLYLLDWEYAAPGSPAFDYAAMALEWGLPLERVHEKSGIDLAVLNDAAMVYSYTCRLWALLNNQVLAAHK